MRRLHFPRPTLPCFLCTLVAVGALTGCALGDEPPKKPEAAGAPAAQSAAPEVKSHYEIRPASPDGIGKVYMGREIAQVMGHQGAPWLERPEREEEEEPQKLVELMALRPLTISGFQSG